MSNLVTMRDVARELKVSVATVSLSLRNQPNVSAAVRGRVLAAVERLGYRPNPYVSALMRTRRLRKPAATGSVLAIVHGLGRPDGWAKTTSVTQKLIYCGVVERARALGYVTEDFSFGTGGMTPRRLGEILRARGIRGILLGPMRDGTSPPALDWHNFATIGIGVPQRDFTMHAVTNDHYFSSLRIMEECHRLNYRRPGLILRESHRAKFQGRWEAGFVHGQQSLGGFARTAPLFISNLEDAALFPKEKFRQWLTEQSPDVIITLAPELIENNLRQLRLSIPRQIGLASLTCPRMGARISGIFQNGALMGATAIDLLIARIERNDTGLPAQTIATMIEGVWNPGKTLRRAKNF